MEEQRLITAIAALLKRSRSPIQFTDAEMEAARSDIAGGSRVLLTTTDQFGEGRCTTYHIDLVQEGL